MSANLRLHGSVLMPVAYFLMRDERFKQLDGLLERDHWSRQQLQELQARKLARLFRVAREHNDYWREKFAEVGLDPAGSDPFAELAKLPILTKDDLRANWKRMRSHHVPQKDQFLETSSGSTGMPVNVYLSRAYRELHAALSYRSKAWMGVQPGDPYLAVQAHGAHLTRRKKWLRQMRIRVDNGIIVDAFKIDPAVAARQLRRAAKLHPVYVHGYTTSVVTVAQIAAGLNLDWSSVRAVSTTSEPLFEEYREILGGAFGAKVFDR